MPFKASFVASQLVSSDKNVSKKHPTSSSSAPAPSCAGPVNSATTEFSANAVAVHVDALPSALYVKKSSSPSFWHPTFPAPNGQESSTLFKNAASFVQFAAPRKNVPYFGTHSNPETNVDVDVDVDEVVVEVVVDVVMVVVVTVVVVLVVVVDLVVVVSVDVDDVVVVAQSKKSPAM